MIHFILEWLCISILLSSMVEPTLGIAPSPWNVLMIIADDLRPQLDCQDLPGTVRPAMHTPHLCELASQSLHLMQNHAPMALCSPSRTATLTSRSTGTTHIWDLSTYFRNFTGNFTTIPQFFRNKGYRTTGIGKIFHEGSASGESKFTDWCPVCSKLNRQDKLYSWSDKVFVGQEIEGEGSKDKSWRVVPDGRELRDTQIMLHAVQTILERGAERSKIPFFLAVGFHKPHLPFTAPEKFYNWYNLEDINLPLNPNAPVNLPKSGWGGSKETLQYVDVKETGANGAMNTTFPDYKVLELRRGYYAAVSYTDHNVGHVLFALRDAGLEEDTIVIFWGDHGWSIGEHGRWDKHTNFDTDTHCPLMIKVPGLTDGGFKSEQLTGLIDLFPTLVELVFGKEVLETELPFCPKQSGDVETCREGFSLVPLLQDPNKQIRDAVYSTYTPGLVKEPGIHGQPSRCLWNDCKMIYSMQTYVKEKVYRYEEAVVYQNFAPRWEMKTGRELLYDHSDDPGENRNIVDEVSPYLRAKLKKKLEDNSVWPGPPDKKFQSYKVYVK